LVSKKGAATKRNAFSNTDDENTEPAERKPAAAHRDLWSKGKKDQRLCSRNFVALNTKWKQTVRETGRALCGKEGSTGKEGKNARRRV